MMSKRKEKISAFLDDDMHRDELMSFSLSGEIEDAKVMQRYQIIGDTMRGEISESSFIDVSHAVRDALSRENIGDTTLAHDAAAVPKQTVAKSSSIWSLSGWLRPVTGMAVAASVAIVVVLGVTGQDQTGVMPVAVNLPGNILPGNITAQPALQIALDNKTINDGAVISTFADNPQVDQYLMNQHLEFATQDTLQGRLPYVRAVSFEPKK
ncbi:MAG: RseA family anti-sigma factor [Gammaproteobacteria bacterium]|nr:RseA family anti-sigma factor [Gammaproteobacteria bacterium]